MHRKPARRILEILKKVRVELSSWLWRRRLTFASSPKPGQWPCGGCARDVGGGSDGKVGIERLYLSPYVEKPFNSKVIKGFVPELRSRYVFFVFPDSYIHMSWTFYVHFTYPYHGYGTIVQTLDVTICTVHLSNLGLGLSLNFKADFSNKRTRVLSQQNAPLVSTYSLNNSHVHLLLAVFFFISSIDNTLVDMMQ